MKILKLKDVNGNTLEVSNEVVFEKSQLCVTMSADNNINIYYIDNLSDLRELSKWIQVTEAYMTEERDTECKKIKEIAG